jgi:hypothetical protein
MTVRRAFTDRRTNAALAWAFTALLLLTAVEEGWAGDYPSAVFAAAVAALTAVPAAEYRSPWVTLPWEVVGLAALPAVGRALAVTELGGALATYLAVAAVALIVAVELHAFTPVRMSYGFAVGFVVVATTATAGLWALTRWAAHLWLGTPFVASEADLMWEFVGATAAAPLAAAGFRLYFGRELLAGRLPSAVDRVEGEP